MGNDDLNKWGQSVIDRVKVDRLKFSEKSLEFSIFYGPIMHNPDLMLIGENPGGKMDEPGLYNIPDLHEYLSLEKRHQYRLAVKMRTVIMDGDKLANVLRNSVKLNRIFFRTPNMRAFYSLPNASEMQEYCYGVLNEIINKIKPKRILAESFGTFKALTSNFESLLENEKKKSLLLRGQYLGIEMYGINHPSSARGISNADWKLVNKELEKRL